MTTALDAQERASLEPVAPRPLSRRVTQGWTPLVMMALSAPVFLAWIWHPSSWRDETATLAISRRSYAEIAHLATNIDAVLTPYYLLVRTVAPGNLTGIRLVSAAAMIGTVGLITWLCHHLAPTRAAIWPGAVLIINPSTSRWAQEARPYALAVLLATAATCLLVTALHRQRRRWLLWALYGTAVAALGYMQLVGLLLLAAHGVSVLLIHRRRFLHWMAAGAVGAAATLPLVILGRQQRRAVAWIGRPDLDLLLHLPYFLLGSAALLWLAWTVLALLAGRRRPANGMVLAIALPWLIVPPALLFAAGQVISIYAERYLLICLPALALLIGSALARVAPVFAVVGLAVGLALAVSTHVEQRTTTGHDGDQGTALRAYIASQVRPGDAVIFSPQDIRLLAEAYPKEFDKLTDVTLGRSGAEAGTLAGEWPPHVPTTVPVRAREHTRIWVISVGTNRRDFPTATALNAIGDYAVVDTRTFGAYQIEMRQR